ncbi:hypothetical protein DFH01_25570 [Falsiroseomonas bella]|uniref:Uncharacterized protein n=1 Tax=Falsiroseomonas bella TaxID=2184016 RepID=A0A317FA92_9PROT|nr:hypothetical protein [Falsiroseomonas bella]PWS34388.1 hypothetical protein DFH01_25570 [Falsiroseomonas bella]
MSSEEPAYDFLARAARRAARGPAPLVAGLFEAWRKAFPDEDPAAALACSGRALTELALCRRPRDEHWVGDVAEIAGALGIDADRLISLLRAAEAVERFGSAHPADASQAGRLLAARDHEADE